MRSTQRLPLSLLVRGMVESNVSRIGLINLEVKHAGERSAGNPPAAFDVAGAGNVK